MYDLKDQVKGLIAKPVRYKKVGIIKMQMVRENESLYGKDRIASAEAAADMAESVFACADRELVVVMSLSSCLEPLALEIVAIGGVSSCQIDIKNIFKHSILNNAKNIICLHNHPSGSATPSKDDKDMTERIRKAGDILDIRLVDHIIIGRDAYYSFKEQKTLHT